MERREEIKKMRNDEIAKELYTVQKERNCLVVLDDLWTTSTWDSLKAAFPEEETESKIILTTRKTNVAFYADNKNVLLHQPRCLNENESWELFVKKSFFGKDATDNYERRAELGREMLSHCAGLPQAIIVLSGLLSTKRQVHEWERWSKNVKSCISRGSEDSEYGGVSSVLGLSYYELPYYLKPCFLYLASYPEDFRINVKSLCHKLIAEGFVSWKSPTGTIEDIAYEHLDELVDRNMIRVEEWGSLGKIKTISIHDLMRDLCLSKAQEENFLQFVDLRNRSKAEETFSFGIERDVSRNKVRRVALYADRHVDDLLPFNRDGSLRSLAFVSGEIKPRVQALKPLFNRFQMLRLLSLENMDISIPRKLPKEIGKLIHLRYLSLRNSSIEEIPSSIGNLRLLQILNLEVTVECVIPNVIWRLEQLRHLYLPIPATHVSGKYLRLPNLGNLQTLDEIPTKSLEVKGLVQLTNLKKLGLKVDEDLGRIYSNSTGIKFNCLQSLKVYSIDVMIDIVPMISWYPHICKLKLWTPVTKLPEAYQFSPSLMKLWLNNANLQEDPMRTLEKLPNLRVLAIGWRSFVGNEMVCSRGGFPQLLSLDFITQDMKEWRIEELGALPRLRRLRICDCEDWRTLPDGLRYVTTLTEVEIEWMPSEFKRRLEEGGEDFYKVQHVPSLVFLNTLA